MKKVKNFKLKKMLRRLDEDCNRQKNAFLWSPYMLGYIQGMTNATKAAVTQIHATNKIIISGLESSTKVIELQSQRLAQAEALLIRLRNAQFDDDLPALDLAADHADAYLKAYYGDAK